MSERQWDEKHRWWVDADGLPIGIAGKQTAPANPKNVLITAEILLDILYLFKAFGVRVIGSELSYNKMVCLMIEADDLPDAERLSCTILRDGSTMTLKWGVR